MLSYLRHEQIDLAKWDACIMLSANGLIYGLSWYLDIVSPGWHAIVKEEEGEYVAVMPIPVARKFGMLYVRQPIFAQQLGVFSKSTVTEVEWQEIAVLLQRKFRMVSRYEFNTQNDRIHPEIFYTYNCQYFTTYHLDLAQGYSRIKAGYRKGRRSDISRAKRNKLKITSSEDIDLLIAMFDEHVAPKIAGVIGEAYEYKMLRQLYREAKHRGMGSLYATVDMENQVQAMGAFLMFNQKIIFLVNCSTPEGKRTGAVTVLVDHVIQKFAGQEIIFDFEAPEVEHLVNFYSSFGPQKAHFLSISLENLPAPIRLLKKVRMQLFQARKKLIA